MTTITQEPPLPAPRGAAPPAGGTRPAPMEHFAVICSKGTLDMAYPGLILANAARMSGIEATMFFTFWGLDIITKKTLNHLQLATVGNPGLHMPTLLGGLPGVSGMATAMMKKEMANLDIPPVGEMLEILHDSGARLYGCKMAMDMFKRTRADLVPQVEDVITAMDFFDKAAGAQVIFI